MARKSWQSYRTDSDPHPKFTRNLSLLGLLHWITFLPAFQELSLHHFSLCGENHFPCFESQEKNEGHHLRRSVLKCPLSSPKHWRSSKQTCPVTLLPYPSIESGVLSTILYIILPEVYILQVWWWILWTESHGLHCLCNLYMKCCFEELVLKSSRTL